MDASNRKQHCIKKHKFPSDFRYDLQWRNINTKKNNIKDEEMVDITCEDDGANNMAAQAKIDNISNAKLPKHFSFGYGIPKAFNKKSQTKKYWHQKDKNEKSRRHIENINMKDISDALEE